jgi:hypothetical protein
MAKEARKKLEDGIRYARVNIEDLHPSEAYLNEEALKRNSRPGKRPTVLEQDGKLYVVNGNSLIMRAYLQGEKDVEVVMHDGLKNPDDVAEHAPAKEAVEFLGTYTFDDLKRRILDSETYDKVDSVKDLGKRREILKEALKGYKRGGK